MNKPAVFLALALTSASAAAHPGHQVAGLAAGLLHPLLGLDHLVAMLIVGVWAAQLGGRARWLVPASFVGLMAMGAALAVGGYPPPRVEAGIAASLLVLGLMVAMRLRLPSATAAALTGGFALFHGAAHGSELPLQASALVYALGFLAATAALHLGGLLLAGSALRRAPWSARLAGAGTAGLGLALVLA